MSRIPAPGEKQAEQQEKQRANAAQERAENVKYLKDSLIAAIGNDDYEPTVRGRFYDGEADEVAREFAQSGWRVVMTGESRAETYFEIAAI